MGKTPGKPESIRDERRPFIKQCLSEVGIWRRVKQAQAASDIASLRQELPRLQQTFLRQGLEIDEINYLIRLIEGAIRKAEEGLQPTRTDDISGVREGVARGAFEARIAALEGERMETVRPYEHVGDCVSFFDEKATINNPDMPLNLRLFAESVAEQVHGHRKDDAYSIAERGLTEIEFAFIADWNGRVQKRVACFSGEMPDGLNGRLAFATQVLFWEFVASDNGTDIEKHTYPFDFKSWYETYDIPALIDFAYEENPEYAKKVFIYFIDQLEDGKKMTMESQDVLFAGRIKEQYNGLEGSSGVVTENMWRAILNMVLLFQLLQGDRQLIFRRSIHAGSAFGVKEGGLAFKQHVVSQRGDLNSKLPPNNEIFTHQPSTRLGQFFDRNWSAEMFLRMAENQGENGGENMFDFLAKIYPEEDCLRTASKNYHALAVERHTQYVKRVNDTCTSVVESVRKFKSKAEGERGKAGLFENKKKTALKQVISKCDEFLQERRNVLPANARKNEIISFLQNLSAELESVANVIDALKRDSDIWEGFGNEKIHCERLQGDQFAFEI